MWFTTPIGREKRDMKYLGKLERILLIGNSTILRQVHYFPTSQLTRFLLNNTVPNRLCLIRGSQWKTKILQTPEYDRAMNPFGSGKANIHDRKYCSKNVGCGESKDSAYLYRNGKPYAVVYDFQPNRDRQRHREIIKKASFPLSRFQRRNYVAQNASQPIHIIDITHKTQFRLIHINLQTGR